MPMVIAGFGVAPSSSGPTGGGGITSRVPGTLRGSTPPYSTRQPGDARPGLGAPGEVVVPCVLGPTGNVDALYRAGACDAGHPLSPPVPHLPSSPTYDPLA